MAREASPLGGNGKRGEESDDGDRRLTSLKPEAQHIAKHHQRSSVRSGGSQIRMKMASENMEKIQPSARHDHARYG